MMKYIQYECEDHVGFLTINRPQALNALNNAVMDELDNVLREIEVSDVRCLVVTGAGDKAFVAGADIGAMKDLAPNEARVFSEVGNAVLERLERLPMPTLAAVNGYALGGGCELALCCDIRVASDKAVFGLPETGLGILPGYGGIQRLVRLVGPAKAKELIFTGNRINADVALAWGLVNAVTPSGQLLDVCREMATKIARNAPLGVRAAKRVADESVGCTLKDSVRLEVEAFSACFDTSDQRMAMAAFLAKRKAEPFTGK